MDELDLSEPVQIVQTSDADDKHESLSFRCSEEVWNEMLKSTADGTLSVALSGVAGDNRMMFGEGRSLLLDATDEPPHSQLALYADRTVTIVSSISTRLSVRQGAVIETATSTINPSLIMPALAPSPPHATSATTGKRKRPLSKETVSSSSDEADAPGSPDPSLPSTSTAAPTTTMTSKQRKKKHPSVAALVGTGTGTAGGGDDSDNASSKAPTPFSSPKLGAVSKQRKNGRHSVASAKHTRSESVSSAGATSKGTGETMHSREYTTNTKRPRSQSAATTMLEQDDYRDDDDEDKGSKLRKSVSASARSTSAEQAQRKSKKPDRRRPSQSHSRRREERWYSSTDDDDHDHRPAADNPSDRTTTATSKRIDIVIDTNEQFESYARQFERAYPSYAKLHALLEAEREAVLVDQSISRTDRDRQQAQESQGAKYEPEEVERLVRRLRREREALEAIRDALFEYKRRRGAAVAVT